MVHHVADDLRLSACRRRRLAFFLLSWLASRLLFSLQKLPSPSPIFYPNRTFSLFFFCQCHSQTLRHTLSDEEHSNVLISARIKIQPPFTQTIIIPTLTPKDNTIWKKWQEQTVQAALVPMAVPQEPKLARPRSSRGWPKCSRGESLWVFGFWAVIVNDVVRRHEVAFSNLWRWLRYYCTNGSE